MLLRSSAMFQRDSLRVVLPILEVGCISGVLVLVGRGGRTCLSPPMASTTGVSGMTSRRNCPTWVPSPRAHAQAPPVRKRVAQHPPQERQVQTALAPIHMSRDEIQQNVMPPLPQVALFRAREGYPTVQERQATVVDIVNQPRRMDARATWYSGGPAGYNGSPRYSSNTLGLA